MILKDKKIVLGVTGAISAYKALELTRLLTKEEAVVWPVMTKSAREFISPLRLATLARNEVFTDMFAPSGEPYISHIELGQGSPPLVVAPAPADLISKGGPGVAAHGGA